MARMFDFDHVGTIDIGRRGEESRYLAFRGDFTAARARSPRVALRVANRFHEKRAASRTTLSPQLERTGFLGFIGFAAMKIRSTCHSIVDRSLFSHLLPSFSSSADVLAIFLAGLYYLPVLRSGQ